MTGLKKRDGDSEGDSGFITPDSTTKEKGHQFSEGEDVLSHGKDGIYYLGTIVVVDTERDRCLIQFEDSTAHWSLFKDITKLKIPESDVLCIVCKSSKHQNGNEIIFCGSCEQAYHQNCLQPRIGDEYCDEVNIEWACPKCASKSQSKKVSRNTKSCDKANLRKTRQNSSTKDFVKECPALPYQLDKLTWDKGHKSNREETYCYCGGPGEWYNGMIRCHRCLQWFHEACVECLNFPLLHGDRFYVFLCSICNKGSEFAHRLPVKWEDVVHLALFDLTLRESRTSFEFGKDIVTWVNRHWDELQGPPEFQRLKPSERKQQISRTLRLNKNRFIYEKHPKKPCQWSLRVCVPPSPPTVSLPPDLEISHHSIKHFTISRKKVSQLSPPLCKLVKPKNGLISTRSNGFPSAKREILPFAPQTPEESGQELRCRENSARNSNQDSQSSENFEPKKRRKCELEKLMEDKKAQKMIDSLDQSPLLDGDQARRKRGKSSEAKSADALPKRRLREREYKEDGLKEKSLSDSSSAGGGRASGSSDETSSRGTLDSFIPPPSNFEGQNHPFFNLDSVPHSQPPSLAANPKPHIPPFKRRLNEADIKIGKNGEVKRKKRRKADKSKFAPTSSHLYADANGCNRSKNVLGLNNQASIVKTNQLAPHHPTPTALRIVQGTQVVPVAHRFSENVSLSDLKTNMTSYFGAASRIASGHKFTILAKRVNSDRKIQYLVEWDNVYDQAS